MNSLIEAKSFSQVHEYWHETICPEAIDYVTDVNTVDLISYIGDNIEHMWNDDKSNIRFGNVFDDQLYELYIAWKFKNRQELTQELLNSFEFLILKNTFNEQMIEDDI